MMISMFSTITNVLSIQPSNITKRFNKNIDICEVEMDDDESTLKSNNLVFFIFVLNIPNGGNTSVESFTQS